MATLTLLGTGSALSGADRENTYMLLVGESTRILIDCAGSPTQRLARLGISPAEIDHVILTHNHPDHLYGISLFVLNAWMAGRRSSMDIYGFGETLGATKRILAAAGIRRLPDMFPLSYHPVKPNSIVPLRPIGEFEIAAAPTVHFVPTMGLRIKNLKTGLSLAYSADTEPHSNIVEIARGARYLFHEATTLDRPSAGHSSAVEAGEVAAEAGVKELVLLHLPPEVKPVKWRAAARTRFKGRIVVASDFDSFEF